ncbi:LytTR family DNA-binding domain-containing protein [Aquimarina sp. 2201CG1-2-11]|uniref:LytR/AlgR family response regulator transcription factor n=1 Tax=Aquimarina discodermiae TaxID=3231043 RepID=UPI0034623B7F
MNIITCFIVEDDIQATEYVTTILKQYKNVNIIGSSDSIKEAANQIKNLRPDFIILDVFLTDGTAFEFLSLFKVIDFKIIFTTSYAKYAIDAFKFSALDYLLKPYEEKELILAINRAKDAIHNTQYQKQLQTLFHNFSSKEKLKKLVLKNAETIHIINIKDIIYAKSDNNYTTFLLTNKKKIVVSKPLKSFDDKLRTYSFLRTHQSFLINMSHISSFDRRKDEVILKEEYIIPVAQSRRKKLIEYLDELF